MRYLIDKSAWARAANPAVGEMVRVLSEAGQLVTCAITNLEILYSARSRSDYVVLQDELRGLGEIPIGPRETSRALHVQGELARSGHHRVAIPDLLIAAAAESVSATILHYDADFERISTVTSQPQMWIVPRGSIS